MSKGIGTGDIVQLISRINHEDFYLVSVEKVPVRQIKGRAFVLLSMTDGSTGWELENVLNDPEVYRRIA